YHLHCGNCAAVHVGRRGASLYAAAPTLLAARCRYAAELRDADASNQAVVRPPLGYVRRRPNRNLIQCYGVRVLRLALFIGPPFLPFLRRAASPAWHARSDPPSVERNLRLMFDIHLGHGPVHGGLAPKSH